MGAGAGATLGKWRGLEHKRDGGLGVAVLRRDDLVVAAIVAVNAVGEIDDGAAASAIRAGTFVWPAPPEEGVATDVTPAATPAAASGTSVENTTIGVILTNAKLDKVSCQLVAQSGHNGLARALFPAHTRGDGDALVAAATGAIEASPDIVRILATLAVEDAVRSVVPRRT